MIGMYDWTVHDDGDDFLRVQQAAAAAAAYGMPLELLLVRIRSANPKGATVDLICDTAKAAGYVPNGTLVWDSKIAADKGLNAGFVVGRTDEGGVVVNIANVRHEVQTVTWSKFALPCERAHSSTSGRGSF